MPKRATLVAEYSNAYAKALKNASPDVYDSVMLSKNGKDLSANLPQTVMRGNVPRKVRNAEQYRFIATQIENIVDGVTSAIANEIKELYGDGIAEDSENGVAFAESVSVEDGNNAVAAGDVFKDGVTGNTVTVVKRNGKKTVLEIDDGKRKYRRTVSDNGADKFIFSGQLERIGGGALKNVERVAKTSGNADLNGVENLVSIGQQDVTGGVADGGNFDSDVETNEVAAGVASVEPKTVELTENGDFLEAYGDNARELAENLGLTLMRRTVDGKKTEVAAFHTSVLDEYRARLGGGYDLSVAGSAPKSGNAAASANGKNQMFENYADTVDGILTVSDDTAKAYADGRVAVEILKNTPDVILNNVEGAKDLRVIINYNKLYLAVRKDGVFKGHYHNLGTEIAKNLPNFLKNPDAIIQLANGRLNLFSTLKNDKGNNSVVSVELNSTKDIGGKNEDYNVVVTMFGSNDNYVKNLVLGDGVSVKYEKEDLSQVNPQLYKLLATVNDKSSSANSIAQNGGKVKSKNGGIGEIINENAGSTEIDGVATDGKNMYKIMDEYGLTYDEQRDIMEYKSSGSYTLNESLRNDETLSPEEENQKKNVNSALIKFPKYTRLVYRNIGFLEVEDFNDFIIQHTGKKSITYSAFTSASKSINGYVVAAPYTVHYEIESLNGRDISSIGIEEEREVLFKTDTTFEFLIVEQTDKHISIKAKEVINNGNSQSYGTLEDGRNEQTVERDASGAANSGELKEVHKRTDTIRGRSSAHDEIYNGTSDSDSGRVKIGSQSQNLGSDAEVRNDGGREELLPRINFNGGLTDKCELITTKHTKTNDDLWVVTLKEKLSTDDFKTLNGKVKAIGGYYSKYTKTPDGKAIHGFVFKTEPTKKELSVFNDFFGYTVKSTPTETQSGAKKLMLTPFLAQ